MDELQGELVLKTRLRHLLSDRVKLHRLRDAVARVDRIVHDAYIFLKLLYCDAFEVALRSRKWDATFWISMPPVTSPDFISDCLRTCSTSLTATGKKQGRAYDSAKGDHMAQPSQRGYRCSVTDGARTLVQECWSESGPAFSLTPPGSTFE